MDAIAQAFGLVTTWDVIFHFARLHLRTLRWCHSRLTATMATAMLCRTFFMEPVAVGVVACSAMAIFAGDIPGALLQVPGTPIGRLRGRHIPSDPKGEGGARLRACVLFRLRLFGTLVLIFAAPSLAEFAIKFSSPEYFWIALLGLTGIYGRIDARGLLSLFIGLTVAGRPNNPAEIPRLTFGSPRCWPASTSFSDDRHLRDLGSAAHVWRYRATEGAPRAVGSIFRDWGWMLKNWAQSLRGNITGTAIGILPGAGADVAAYVSYAVSRRFSKSPEKYEGHVEGVMSCGGKQCVAFSTWVPALVFVSPATR